MKRYTAALIAGLGLTLAAPAAGQTSDALQVHGYLTQGWADATDYGYLGIPEDPTTDYRALALQVRYAFTGEDALVLQFSHRRMGTSILNDATDDVALDWAFFQHKFGSFNARAGRVPMPRGLYNEVRDVGTLLPFFRAPFNFYTEGVETLDGGSLSHTLSIPGGWSVESNLFAGAWDYQQISTREGVPVFVDARVNDVVGVQGWLLAPVPGVRFGAGGMRFETEHPALGGRDEEVSGTLYQLSAEGRFSRVRLAAEWERFEPGAFDYDAWYVSGGVRAVRSLWVNAQVEAADMSNDLVDLEYSRDYALGVSWAFSHRVVLKLEGHEVQGYNLDAEVDMTGPGLESRYVVASLSAAF